MVLANDLDQRYPIPPRTPKADAGRGGHGDTVFKERNCRNVEKTCKTSGFLLSFLSKFRFFALFSKRHHTIWTKGIPFHRGRRRRTHDEGVTGTPFLRSEIVGTWKKHGKMLDFWCHFSQNFGFLHLPPKRPNTIWIIKQVAPASAGLQVI